MSWSGIRYEPIEGVEDIAGYEEGGLHPISIGDTLDNGRFDIINKLGSGSFSTVWLARDNQIDTLIALKIHRADKSEREQDDKTIDLLLRHENDNRRFVLLPTEHFFTESINGNHLVEVYPVAGESAYHRINAAEHDRLELSEAKRAILHAARGLQFLHSAGIGHGDLYSSNILQCLQINSANPDVKEKLLSCQPELVAVERLDGRALDHGVPEYAIVPLDMKVLAPYCQAEALADLGSIFTSPSKGTSDDTLARNTICSPERLVGLPFDLSADIWALGCLIFELLFGFELFDAFPRSGYMVFRSVVRLLGKPPHDIVNALDQPLSEEQLNAPETLKDYLNSTRTGNEEENLPNREDDFSEDEMNSLVDLLTSMLQYDATRRPDIEQVLDHSWMQSLCST